MLTEPLRILYKTRLPFILVFNKIDVQSHDFALEWMNDFQAYQDALSKESNADGETGYMNSLMGSMCLVLDEFYSNLRVSCNWANLHCSRTADGSRLWV